MPEALIITDQTYAGDAASYMISHAVVGGDTISKGNIYVEDGIKKQKTIPRVDVTNIMQPRSAEPVSSGSITIDGQLIAPKDSMLYMEFSPRDFEQQWFAYQLPERLMDAQMPATANEFVMLQLMRRANEFFELGIWRSRQAYNPLGLNVDPTTKGALASDAAYYYWDGLIAKALANANTIKVPSPVALTSSNIVTYFQAAYYLIPSALLYRYDKLKLFVSYKDQQKYENYMQTVTTFKNQDTTQKGLNRFNGYQVQVLSGLPENTFLWAIGTPDIDSNLWMGINSTEDNELAMMRKQNNAETWFIKGLFKTDVQFGFYEEAVLYTTQTL
jgi:hypothetical protein